MTQIVKEIPKPTDIITLDEHRPDSYRYYGVRVGANADAARGYLMSMDYATNTKYRVVCLAGMTHGNGWSLLPQDMSLNESIHHLVNHPDCAVFEFETAAELFDWLLRRDQDKKTGK